MPYTDVEVRKAKQREYAKNHREEARERTRRWRQRNPERVSELARIASATPKRKAQKAKAARVLRASKRKLVDAAKDRPCADCGQSYPAPVMDLHHFNGDGHLSPYKISGLQLSLEALMSEIAKCVVLCANCHRLRHHLDRP